MTCLYQRALPLCSRHPVRHLSFTSHSLITANVPCERVVPSADPDSFATHRRSVGSAAVVWMCRKDSYV